MNHVDTIDLPPWRKNKFLLKLFQEFEKENIPLYIVGGAVRDALNSMLTSDIDLATAASPEEIIRIAQRKHFPIKTYSKCYGSILFIHAKKSYVCTTFRHDILTDGRHATVSYDANMLEDAKRRDFTVNAIYASFCGKVYTPLPLSLHHLKKKELHFIGNPEKRLSEDYLRLLRYYRFSGTYKPIHVSSLLPTFQKTTPYLKKISKERIFDELKKMFLNQNYTSILKLILKTPFFSIYFPQAHHVIIENIALSTCECPPFSWPIWLWILQANQWPQTRREKKSYSQISPFLKKISMFKKNYQYCLYEAGLNITKEIAILHNISHKKMLFTPQWFSELEKTDQISFPLQTSDLVQTFSMEGKSLGKAYKTCLGWWLRRHRKPCKNSCLAYIRRNIL